MSNRMIEPLRDDCTEQASAFRRWWAKRWDGGNSLLRKSLLYQLRQRPDIEHKDLWTDEVERQISAYCLRAFKECLGLPNERLIADDPLEMVASIDGEGFEDVLKDLEQKFRFIFDQDVWKVVKTFGDLVRYVREHQGSAALAELQKRYRIGWGYSTIGWLVFFGVIGCFIYKVIEVGKAVTRSGELDFWQIIGLVFSLLVSGFVMYMAYAVVINWCKERKALREEQEKLERGANEHT